MDFPECLCRQARASSLEEETNQTTERLAANLEHTRAISELVTTNQERQTGLEQGLLLIQDLTPSMFPNMDQVEELEGLEGVLVEELEEEWAESVEASAVVVELAVQASEEITESVAVRAKARTIAKVLEADTNIEIHF